MIEWINANYSFLMVAITVVYVVATILICIYNKKSATAAVSQANQEREQAKEYAERADKQAKQAQKALQKLIDLQLYDKMLEVANNIENDDYSNSTMEISLLFSNEILFKVRKLRRLEEEYNRLQNDLERYYKLREQEGYDISIAISGNLEGASNEAIEAAAKQEEEFEAVFSGYYDENGNPGYYVYSEITSDISRIDKELSEKKKQLKLDIHAMMKSKLSVE